MDYERQLYELSAKLDMLLSRLGGEFSTELLSVYLKNWLQHDKKGRIRDSTYVTYSHHLKRWGLLAQALQRVQYQRANPVCPTVLSLVMQLLTVYPRF